MIPQDRIILLISLLLLLFVNVHEIRSQNTLAPIFQTLLENHPELFETNSDTLTSEHLVKDSEIEVTKGKSSNTKDEYSKNRLSLNLCIAASSIYQGAIIANLFSVKETAGTPPFTFDIYTRTAFGKAFPYLFTGGMSIGAIIINAGKPIQPGLSSMYLYGSFIGLFHGTLISSAFTDNNASDYSQQIALWGGSLSLAEGMWLTYFAKKNKFTSQETNLAISTNFYGGIIGAGIGGIISNNENQNKVLALGALGGSIGGTYISKYLIKNRNITNGDLTVMNAASALGLFIGMTINVHSENRLMTSIGYITSIGSTFAGSYFLTKYHPFSVVDGLKITLGTGAGLLAGMGFSLATQSRTFHSALFSMVSGAILGFAGTTYQIMKSYHTGNQLIYQKKKTKNQLRYNFNPGGLVLNLRNQHDQLKMMQSGMNGELLQLQYRF